MFEGVEKSSAAQFQALCDDAGVAKDDPGILRLAELDKRSIGSGAVSAMSAPIGRAREIYGDGILSHVNATAARLGAIAGMLQAHIGAVS
ncbi:MAG: hypothetical protein E6Q77_00090 [Rhizobium sp.]|nr:MAG: hypothetical protein E6Q77_00090 [Rhizobium sp.]